MLRNALFALWFLLPAGLANMTPIIANVIPLVKRWETPLDFGLMLRGRRLFGPNKRWRGLLTGMVVATVIFILQQQLVRHNAWFDTTFNHYGFSRLPLVLGPLLGFGALAGDALKSFFKRQAGIAAGRSWPPFDQLDYIIGAVLVSLPFTVLPLAVYIWIFVLWFGLHLLFTTIGWALGLKDQPI